MGSAEPEKAKSMEGSVGVHGNRDVLDKEKAPPSSRMDGASC